MGFRDLTRKMADVFSPSRSGLTLQRLPQTRVDFEGETGTAWLNRVVALCLSFYGDNVSEPRLRVVRQAGSDEEELPGHAALSFMQRPNPYYDLAALLSATVLSYKLDGNAYWLKLKGREGLGRTRALWYVPHWEMTPEQQEGSSKFISRYVREVDGRRIYYRPDEVIHFRDGLDPDDPRRGLALFKAQLKGLYTDNAIDTYTAALMKNGAVPAYVLSPKDPKVTVNKDSRDTLKAQWKQENSGDGVGGVSIPSVAVDVEKVGYSPQDLALDRLGFRSEASICSHFRISPMCLDLPVGLEHSTYSNKGEAIEGFYNEGLMPTLARFAAALSSQLLPEYTTDGAVRFAWDYSQVRALAGQRMRAIKEASDAYAKGSIKRSHALRMMGLKPAEGDDVYITDLPGWARGAAAAAGGA